MLMKWIHSARLETRTKESNMYASIWVFKLICEMKVRDMNYSNIFNVFIMQYRPNDLRDWFEFEHICWDPKDGELCVCRVKPEETLVEARSDTNVQIVRLTYV